MFEEIMLEIETSLIHSGLSPVEAKTYFCILTNGPIPAGKVAKLTNNYRANIYQAIERLKSKGFIAEIQGKKSKEFEALSPTHLLEDQQKKQTALEKVIPLLQKAKSSSISSTQIRIIEGKNGWRHLLNEFLEIGKERIVYGIPNNAIEVMDEFLKHYHQRRAQGKIQLKHLYNHDAKNRIKITNKIPYTNSKYLPPELNQPMSTSVCGSIIALTIYQGKDILTLVIDNKIVANTYRKYFEFLWKIGKE